MTTKKTPYVGIMGFTSHEEVSRMLDVFEEHFDPLATGRLLQVGVMIGRESFDRSSTKGVVGSSLSETLENVFQSHPHVMNVIRYVNGHSVDACNDLLAACAHVGDALNAVELDMVWPDPQQVVRFRRMHFNTMVIIDVGIEARAVMDNDPMRIVHKLAQYGTAIDYALIRTSCTCDELLDRATHTQLLQKIGERLPRLGLSVGGGFGPDTIHTLSPIVAMYPYVSVSAHHKLCYNDNPHSSIDWEKARSFLIRSSEFIK